MRCLPGMRQAPPSTADPGLHLPTPLPPLQCALVVGSLWLVGDVGVRKRILRCLHQKGRTLASLRSVLLEYRANLGDEGGLYCPVLPCTATDAWVWSAASPPCKHP